MKGWAVVVAFAVLGGAAVAQNAPAPRPDLPPADEHRPAPKPKSAADAEPPPQSPPAAPPETKPQEPALRFPVQPDASPSPQPALKYPDQPAAPAPQDATQPEASVGPPVHETLREDDFTYSACLLGLSQLGAVYTQEAAITDPDQRDCGIDRPIMLQEPLPGIAINGGAMMRCETAWHLAHWLRDFVRPASAMLPGQPQLAGIEPGSTYQCRPTVGDKGVNLSEHAFGNAFDVAAFTFRDGSRLTIEPRKDSGDMAEAFQTAIRGAACLHFTTVLGPGANAAHDDHLHLDIKARDSGWRLCQ
ncbi:extensin family protein [Paracoccus laeviglucosivorans]|uniref:Uncharacterized conserved protein n=1 Tax=Paracoccus laeviglucosivorans TaxID=1197861 RepID=A0A521DCQ1_9RHOB|nr:extensin family protein [Paracoccus laeviglucosivorans]SMO69352.1 Uncharacterized conserved protein [Paracoccus laeviglucosivorans]